MISKSEKKIFGENANVLEKTSLATTYQIECDTPQGIMKCYHLFPGIDLAYTYFEATTCFVREKSLTNVLEIAYCKAGRFECEYKHGYFTYLGEGDFAVSLMSSQSNMPVFPMGYYDGFAIIIDKDIAGECLEGIVEGVSININLLEKKFCDKVCCSVTRALPDIRHVFDEIYSALKDKKLGYLRLKVLEVFYLLSEEVIPSNDFKTSKYFSGAIIKKIKALRNDLTQDLDKKVVLKDMADKYGISLTMMKDCFKAVYGSPVYSYRREYKIQTATKLLTATDMSIAEIAGKLGYENPNKFSSSFKKIIGKTPREYRQNNR